MVLECGGISSRLIKGLKFRNQGIIFSFFPGRTFFSMEKTRNKPTASPILNSTGAKL